MEFKIMLIIDFEILEIERGGIYEYYVKAYNKNDFIFAFGVVDRFSESQLRALIDKGYFENFED